MSRPKRWAAAVEKVRDGLTDLQELKDEYQDWRDGLPENLESSPVAEKLDAIVDSSFVDDIESGADEAEGIELPLGFGRD